MDAELVERQHAEKRAELEACGYQVTEAYKIKAGARVCHSGQRWFEAMDKGTATVLVVMEKPDSLWSRSWGGPDIEILVACDKPTFTGAPVGQWANYHTRLAFEQPKEN